MKRKPYFVARILPTEVPARRPCEWALVATEGLRVVERDEDFGVLVLKAVPHVSLEDVSFDKVVGYPGVLDILRANRVPHLEGYGTDGERREEYG